ncbi:MAG: 50S ribosomal protein L21 [Gammaproteobacteria bacterium]|nr:50S ribosomal protein L21 [Gammaproteobacteria bacterium]MBP9728566.1 50S ribosomal protein L21 [Gammaproteobacteria bacterium]
MHAVIISGGKQHRVRAGELLKVEKLALELGDSVAFEQVLMVSDGETIRIGAPYVAGVVVKAEVVTQDRLEKIRIIKMKRRKHHMKRMGHRQWYTELKITEIQVA